MSIYVGNTKIGQMYLGSTEIAEAYLGGTKVYSSASPYDAKVEYLESSGTQYINTGILCQSGLSYEMVATPLSGGNAYQVYFGVSKNSKYAFMAVLNESSANFYSQCGSSSYGYNGAVITFGSQCSINGSTNGTTVYLTVNNTSSTSTGGTSYPDANLHIFANHNGNNAATFRLHSLKIMLNNVHVRDFIPVRVGQVGYMYDRVSGQLFGNSGSGSFVLGNDVS